MFNQVYTSIPIRRGVSCDFTIVKVTDGMVAIQDECNTTGGRSVTNAAEEVCKFLCAQFPARRIIYKDSMGQWDEMVTKAGRFHYFKPMPECFRLQGDRVSTGGE